MHSYCFSHYGKPQPNDRNILQHMLRAFGHHVVTCCDMLGVVDSNLKMVKLFTQLLWTLHDVVIWPGSCNNVAPGHAH